jgi:hypothetical protein
MGRPYMNKGPKLPMGPNHTACTAKHHVKAYEGIREV